MSLNNLELRAGTPILRVGSLVPKTFLQQMEKSTVLFFSNLFIQCDCESITIVWIIITFGYFGSKI